MPKVKVDGIEVEVEQGASVLQACELAGKEIPRFCYHERLSIAGNCRMCLVEMEKSPKPIASCAMPVAEGQVIYTNSDMVKKAREGVMEFLLINHPLDCPICDQGGECDLQDQSVQYGGRSSRYELNKRSVKEKYMGPLIKTQMNRCIHCTRCIRFAEEIAGVPDLGAINRGENMEITTFLEKTLDSELSANVIDLCPVGALTSKPYAFEARPWELTKTESIDVMDAVGSNIRIDTKGWEVKRVLPRVNDDINEEWISDKTRYACDGLLNNRIDQPYIRKNGKLVSATWDEAFQRIKQEFAKTVRIGGLIGELVDLETIFALKNFLITFAGSPSIDFRQTDFFINPSHPSNYLFNTSIANIDNADLILLVGANPRLEATIINARIRKNFVKNNINIYSIGDPGDQTYKINILGDNLKILNEIENDKSIFSEKIKLSKNPIIIIGESVLNAKQGSYVLESTKRILKKFNALSGLNILHQKASSVGALMLQAFNLNEDVTKNEILYLIGADEIEIDKKDKFIIYQGSHASKNTKIADVVLPGAAYTEKDGLYVNLEGRVQSAFKASFPPGEAKEDWKILRALSEALGKPLKFNTLDQLRNKMFESYPQLSTIDQLPRNDLNKLSISNTLDILDSKVIFNSIDYYQSNEIARSSKTMLNCKLSKNELSKTGTEN
jgi:NADH-quinone oxidoreductase subunit G